MHCRDADFSSCAAAGAPSGGPRKVLAPQWTAKLVYNAHMVGMNMTDGRGHLYYDQLGERYRLNVVTDMTVFEPNGTMYRDQLFQNISGTTGNFTVGGEDGVCLPYGQQYVDLFGWMSVAKKIGERIIAGERCEVWSAMLVEPMFIQKVKANNTACIAADGVPRDFLKAFTSEKFSGYAHYEMSEVVVGDPGAEAFRPSRACAANYPAAPCGGADRVSELSVYRVWAPPEPLELDNRNTGDAMGDLSFLCTQGSGEAYRSKLITYWKVDAREDWGQYAMCNFNGRTNVCLGETSMLMHVGRRASQLQSEAPAAGQCSSNVKQGSQYSFPRQAKCLGGATPSLANDCAWADPRPVRTIRASCLLEDRGLLKACQGELGHAPFAESLRIWEAAFASRDPTTGGCPEVDPNELATLSV